MRTVESINLRIDSLIKESAKIRKDKLIPDPEKKRQIKPIAKEFKFLKKIRNYLEYKPSEQSLLAQKAHLEKLIMSHNQPNKFQSWYTWCDKTNKAIQNNPRKAFETEFIKPLREKLNTINYILNENVV